MFQIMVTMQKWEKLSLAEFEQVGGTERLNYVATYTDFSDALKAFQQLKNEKVINAAMIQDQTNLIAVI